MNFFEIEDCLLHLIDDDLCYVHGGLNFKFINFYNKKYLNIAIERLLTHKKYDFYLNENSICWYSDNLYKLIVDKFSDVVFTDTNELIKLKNKNDKIIAIVENDIIWLTSEVFQPLDKLEYKIPTHVISAILEVVLNKKFIVYEITENDLVEFYI